MLVASLAISGIFPFAGFFSKDEILWSAWANGHPVIYLAGLATAALTAFYMFRLTFLAFYGEERFTAEVRHHLHESPPSMTIPLTALAVLSVVGGFVGLPAWMGLGPNRFDEFLEPALNRTRLAEVHDLPHSMELLFAIISVVAALSGIYVAYRLYIRNPGSAEAIAQRFRILYTLSFRKYFVDEAYDAALVHPILGGSREILWKGLDAGAIDGSVNGVGRSIRGWGALLRHVQNGLARSYATWILVGTAILLYYVVKLRG
jgi:NADH-quinone oxidoreductase subunit L